MIMHFSNLVQFGPITSEKGGPFAFLMRGIF